MSVAYDPARWHDLFVATTGASAALAGLLFVAVSINVDRILEYEGLAERGLETLGLLLAALVVSIACLIPAQSHAALGLELLAITAAIGALLYMLPVPPELPGDIPTPPNYFLTRSLTRYSGPALLTIGALTVLIGSGGGLYWVVAGIVFLILGAVANAWVLLVEILR